MAETPTFTNAAGARNRAETGGRKTKTALRALAKDATRYGLFKDGREVYVACPSCQTEVRTEVRIWTTDRRGRRLSEVAQLRAAVLDHLNWRCDPDAREPYHRDLAMA